MMSSPVTRGAPAALPTAQDFDVATLDDIVALHRSVAAAAADVFRHAQEAQEATEARARRQHTTHAPKVRFCAGREDEVNAAADDDDDTRQQRRSPSPFEEADARIEITWGDLRRAASITDGPLAVLLGALPPLTVRAGADVVTLDDFGRVFFGVTNVTAKVTAATRLAEQQLPHASGGEGPLTPGRRHRGQSNAANHMPARLQRLSRSSVMSNGSREKGDADEASRRLSGFMEPPKASPHVKPAERTYALPASLAGFVNALQTDVLSRGGLGSADIFDRWGSLQGALRRGRSFDLGVGSNSAAAAHHAGRRASVAALDGPGMDLGDGAEDPEGLLAQGASFRDIMAHLRARRGKEEEDASAQAQHLRDRQELQSMRAPPLPAVVRDALHSDRRRKAEGRLATQQQLRESLATGAASAVPLSKSISFVPDASAMHPVFSSFASLSSDELFAVPAVTPTVMRAPRRRPRSTTVMGSVPTLASHQNSAQGDERWKAAAVAQVQGLHAAARLRLRERARVAPVPLTLSTAAARDEDDRRILAEARRVATPAPAVVKRTAHVPLPQCALSPYARSSRTKPHHAPSPTAPTQRQSSSLLIRNPRSQRVQSAADLDADSSQSRSSSRSMRSSPRGSDNSWHGESAPDPDTPRVEPRPQTAATPLPRRTAYDEPIVVSAFDRSVRQRRGLSTQLYDDTQVGDAQLDAWLRCDAPRSKLIKNGSTDLTRRVRR
jgi:hypothetical protein